MTELFLGRIDKIVLIEDPEHTDIVEVRDVLGGRLKVTPIGARALHKELGKFLAIVEDQRPLPVPSRADFRSLEARVKKLEAANE